MALPPRHGSKVFRSRADGMHHLRQVRPASVLQTMTRPGVGIPTLEVRAATGPDDQLRREPAALGAPRAEPCHHELDGDRAEAELRLAHGGEGNAEVLGGEDVSEAGDGDVLGNAKPLSKEGLGGADGHEVVDGLDGGGPGLFLHPLERGVGALLERGAGVEDKGVVRLDPGIAQGPAIPLEPFMSGG